MRINDEEISSTANVSCTRFHYSVIFFFAATIVFAQDTPHSEEYMQQHDGVDRTEYLQEMEHNDPQFYVPPVNEASLSPTSDSDGPAN